MKLFTPLFTVLFSCAIAFSAQAKDQRDYHEMVYDSGCKTCHDQGMKAFPSDEACLQCHDMGELAKQTQRKGHEAAQNPHDSMHYGQEAPCMECHGEHTTKQAICMDCHNFDYPKFK
ncbi:cytochrome c3 family protein [Shewanella japonica]|uniref:Cytochrome C n=1 Tax=Shewanella japonica TaxID=93973 RepID=A0ABN4YA28_9GAMM|nr:cytochrome c3 family protein [Shewanella japonica]ARD20878.1 cytochrome C [Shewanella japonica]